MSCGNENGMKHSNDEPTLSPSIAEGWWIVVGEGTHLEPSVVGSLSSALAGAAAASAT